MGAIWAANVGEAVIAGLVLWAVRTFTVWLRSLDRRLLRIESRLGITRHEAGTSK